MNRHDFGFWGIDLDPDSFARALAALGVLQAAGQGEPVIVTDAGGYAERLREIFHADVSPSRPSLRWELPVDDFEFAASDQAIALSDAWKQVIDHVPAPRLEVQFDWRHTDKSPVWLVEQLSLPAAGLASVYVNSGQRPARARTGWEWPLEVGFLADAASRELGETLASDHWAGHLADLVDIGRDRQACDILLLPFGLRESVTRVLQTPVQASCVFMLGELGEPWERARPMLETIEAHTRSTAIGILHVPRTWHSSWFHELLRELAHDEGLDVALRRAGYSAAPLLMSSRRFLDRTRMTEAAAALGRRIGRADMVDRDVDWAAVISRAAGVHAMTPPSAGAAPEEALSALPFDRESEGASVVAEVARAVRTRPPVRKPRFLQAQVLGPGEPHTAVRRTTVLRAHTDYQIGVRIGPDDATWIGADAVFPDEELPESDEPHRLRVVFTDLRLEREPQTGEITLPGEGPSTEIRFAMRTGPEGERIEARIIVLHRNRVLQTVLLRGGVANASDPADVDEITMVTEVIARARLDDLSSRSRFDAALVLNHTDEGRKRLTRITGEHVDVSTPVDIDQAVSMVRLELETFINQLSERVELESEEVTDLLIRLARQGRTFYDAIVLDQIGKEFAEANRIQIVAAVPEAYLPIEFVYERKAPNLNAELCPHASQALREKCCPKACTKEADQASVVCPLGFWSMTKVIERHVHTSERANDLRRDYALLREPVDGRTTIGPLGNITFAASARVDAFREGMAAEAVQSLKKATRARVSESRTWKKWVNDVAELAPSLLVILPHTINEDGIATMEVGKRAHLGTVDIGPMHISASDSSMPIVLLLGCETGDPKLAFQGFPAAFRRHGAAIVLATLTTVLGRHAAPVAARIVTALMEQSQKEAVSFGDVMLDMRRQLLLDGYPMVLALTSYGDADWRFGA